MSTCYCFKGTAGDSAYEPKGSFSTLSGLPIYRSTPQNRSPNSHRDTILYLPDGFGLAKHNQRLADKYAQYGYETVIVDYFEGDALPDTFMLYTPGTDLDAYDNLTSEQKETIRKIDMPSWLKRHTPEHISSLVAKFFPEFCTTVAEGNRGPKARIHILGHCFGGKHAFKLAQLDHENVGSILIFHPSFLEPSDLKGLKKPVLVGCAETDVFTPDLIQTILNHLPGCGTTWKFLVYGGTQHGFATRPDLGNELTAKMFQQAFDDGLQWLKTN
ncbi:alpha/beta-hydrolase [Daldinia loculata]|uniref:alpha/beta-hydrolase n=1 Tax=Daldinia loculata TaxID=103429 RepID=UPI0020C442FE|nr:alpha/beta-hydrolase [Daldinia loculata]KAI1641593.1 alpha/beta-hydrolase [Daldinia loculata]